MPEGPEIRRAADELAAVLEGNIVEVVDVGLPKLRPYKKQLQGDRINRLETRGKALLTHFEQGLSIYSHNQLYGIWQVTKRGRLPDTSRSLRLGLHTAKHSALLYSASDISVWPTTEIDQHPFLAKLGPDVLTPTLTWRDISTRLTESRFVKRQLASLYLDQSFIAGIGNYLRSEILFFAGIDPCQTPGQLSTKQRNDLARATLAVSQRSYNTGGITNRAGWYRQAKKSGRSAASARFAVFERDGRPCPACGAPIGRVEMDSRRLYLCGRCQVSGPGGHSQD